MNTPDEQFRLLVDAVKDHAIFMVDPGGVVVTWNPGAPRIKGYTPEQIIGRHFSAFYTPEDQKAGVPARGLQNAIRDGATPPRASACGRTGRASTRMSSARRPMAAWRRCASPRTCTRT